MLKISRIYLVALLSLGALAVTGTALAAHNGNNKADLSGAGGVTGVAVVNYSEGQGTFNGTITVQGLAPNTSYSFYVTGAGAGAAGRLICSDTSNSTGTFTCNAQGSPCPGSRPPRCGRAAARSLRAVFERRGNCRDPQQAGSQCKAPGQQP